MNNGKWAEMTAVKAIQHVGGIVTRKSIYTQPNRPFSNRACGATDYLTKHCGYRFMGIAK